MPLPAFLKDLLARSAMKLSSPAMERAAKGEDSVTQCRRQRALTRRWPILDFLEDRWLAQETVEVLSTQAAVC